VGQDPIAIRDADRARRRLEEARGVTWDQAVEQFLGDPEVTSVVFDFMEPAAPRRRLVNQAVSCGLIHVGGRDVAMFAEGQDD